MRPRIVSIRSLLSRLSVVALPSLVCLFACGGRVTGADGGTGTATSDEPDSGSGIVENPAIPCPLLLPPAGLSCSYPAGTVCVYVGGGIPCHAAECDATGHWQTTHDGC